MGWDRNEAETMGRASRAECLESFLGRLAFVEGADRATSGGRVGVARSRRGFDERVRTHYAE